MSELVEDKFVVGRAVANIAEVDLDPSPSHNLLRLRALRSWAF
jgi:hypothetical protein